tara:strand:+ start:4962 stop:5324 length:363 start_codon:yes stop_codon:yes gene_type:complete
MVYTDEHFTFTLNEPEAHALQLAVADQLMMFANIVLDPEVSNEPNDEGHSTLSMAKDILNRYQGILDKIDFGNHGILDAWNKTYEIMKEETLIPVEDNVIEVDFKKEIDDAINNTDEEDQ